MATVFNTINISLRNPSRYISIILIVLSSQSSLFAPSLEEELKSACELLGVSQNASLEEINRAYRQKAFRYHPDKVDGISEDQIKLINKARDTIIDSLYKNNSEKALEDINMELDKLQKAFCDKMDAEVGNSSILIGLLYDIYLNVDQNHQPYFEKLQNQGAIEFALNKISQFLDEPEIENTLNKWLDEHISAISTLFTDKEIIAEIRKTNNDNRSKTIVLLKKLKDLKTSDSKKLSSIIGSYLEHSKERSYLYEKRNRLWKESPKPVTIHCIKRNSNIDNRVGTLLTGIAFLMVGAIFFISGICSKTSEDDEEILEDHELVKELTEKQKRLFKIAGIGLVGIGAGFIGCAYFFFPIRLDAKSWTYHRI